MIMKLITRRSRAKRIKLIILDVDGVLTDAGVYYDNHGVEIKRFNVRDGSGIKMAMHMGINFVIVTGRTSNIVKVRARELGVKHVYQGALKKHLILGKILQVAKVKKDEVAFIADDIIDLELFKQVGFRVAVKDAVMEIKRIADFVTKNKGGHGAVRDFIEYVMKAKGLWEEARKRYLVFNSALLLNFFYLLSGRTGILR